MRKPKIDATLGPVSSNENIIQALFDAGVDVFRLNFSHNNAEFHKKNATIIRNIENIGVRPVAILMDLQGPKFRIGVFEDGSATLVTGAKFVLDMENSFGNDRRVCLPHPEIFDSLQEGTDIFLDDGKIKLRVCSNNGYKIETEVISGGILLNKKGFNIPNAMLDISAITQKDKDDLQFVDAIGADYVAVSFVQTDKDIESVRQLIPDYVKIVAKIEKPKAVENIHSIAQAADAIMVARGDLGVENPVEDVPFIQQQIVDECLRQQKPVIIATQMLESMISAPMPTRAEVSDIAHAVYQGADAVMLSAETANGQYPVQAVEMMRKVIDATEKHSKHECTSTTTESCLINAVVNDGIDAVVAFTESGRTAINASNSRLMDVIAMTPNTRTTRRMCLVWGVHSILVEDIYNFAQMLQIVDTKLPTLYDTTLKLAVVAGVPFRESGTTNVLHIYEMKNHAGDQ